MTTICERRVVHCPEHEASHYLAAFVDKHQAGDGTVRLVFHFAGLHICGLPDAGRTPRRRHVVFAIDD
jgi:hypothetical protein